MKEQVLNEIVKFDSTAEYYQQLEKSILGNQSCYEATVVDGELLGMKVLVCICRMQQMNDDRRLNR